MSAPRFRGASAPRYRGYLCNTESLQNAGFAMTNEAIAQVGDDVAAEDSFADFHGTGLFCISGYRQRRNLGLLRGWPKRLQLMSRKSNALLRSPTSSSVRSRGGRWKNTFNVMGSRPSIPSRISSRRPTKSRQHDGGRPSRDSARPLFLTYSSFVRVGRLSACRGLLVRIFGRRQHMSQPKTIAWDPASNTRDTWSNAAPFFWEWGRGRGRGRTCP